MAEAQSTWTLNKPDNCRSPIPPSAHIDPADDPSNVQADQDLSKTRILRVYGTQTAAGRSSVGLGDWVDVLENGERELLKRVCV